MPEEAVVTGNETGSQEDSKDGIDFPWQHESLSETASCTDNS